MRFIAIFNKIKYILSVIIIGLISCASIAFCVLYLQTFNIEIITKYKDLIVAISILIITVSSIITISNLDNSDRFIYKISIFSIFIFFFALLSIYFLKKTGILNGLSNFDDLKFYINSFGACSDIIYVLIQFLQVVALPVPSILIIGVGVFIFGTIKTIFLSSIGIILGSIVAFVVGKYLGSKVVKWIIGEKTLNKVLNMISGKDKFLITFMLLFPFFPDDAICFVAGIAMMDTRYFIVMIIIVRVLTITLASLLINNNIIPFNTWWGILLWGLIFILTIFLTIFIYIKSNNFQNILKTSK